MVACDIRFLSKESNGASVLEVLLAMAIIAMATPFVYDQVSETNMALKDMAEAKKIIALQDDVLNFVRLNQGNWPEVAQIKLSEEELDSISEKPSVCFVDKYVINGGSVTDVYLSFDLKDTQLRVSRIAKHIGADAAVVGLDGVAYGDSWAVAAPEFKYGDLIYRISKDIDGEDKTKYLHRTGMGDENLNMMLRDLNMGGNNIFNVGGVQSKTVEIRNLATQFIEVGNIMSDAIYFSSGATLYGDTANIENLRVTGDVSGFRNIYADTLNGEKYTTRGSIITDRATINNSVNISNNFILKSDEARTISGFTGIIAHSVDTSSISAEEIVFYEDFGLTVSGELLMSTTAPLRIGSWTFPSLTPPSFYYLELSRAKIPSLPPANEFGIILSEGWQTAVPKE